MGFKGKIAIVTGASGGIGLATARLLSAKGAKVALVARSEDKLKQLAKELPGSLAVPADMCKPAEVAAMVESVKKHFGGIDILVNNAGRGYDAPIEKTNPQTLKGIIDLDLIGPLMVMEQVIPVMKTRGGGSIVNVSSGTALMHLPNMGGYSAVKAALAHLSLTAREELKRFKITVGVVYPYITLTDFEDNTIKDTAEEDWTQDGDDYEPPKADTAEYAAGLIFKCIQTGAAEIYAHEWMKDQDEGRA